MSGMERQGFAQDDAAVDPHNPCVNWNLCSLSGHDNYSSNKKSQGIGAEDIPNLSIDTGASSNAATNYASNAGISRSVDFARIGDPSAPVAQHPFSASEVANAGVEIANELRVGSTDQRDVISNIRAYDRNQQELNQDIADYSKSGAVGGIQTLVLNDCWFESSLAAMANTPGGPEKVAQMITSNPDGGYTVVFPGKPDAPIALTKDEVDKDSRVTNTAEWAKVLEAAILKADPYDCTQGGFATNAIELLTGKQSGYAFTSDYKTGQMAALIASAMHQNKPVVVDSNQTVPPADGSQPPPDQPPPVQPPIIDGHTYAVTGFDPATNVITLRNPWGTNDIDPGTQENGVIVRGAGQISMSIDTFMQIFRQVSFGT